MARKNNDPVSSAPDTSPDTPVSEKQSASGSPWYQVSGWKLRNKIALALAFPMVAASWFATDKAIESYLVQRSHEATSGQVAVLAPALDFLYAAENSYVQTMQTAPGSPERIDAAARVKETAAALEKVAEDDALTQNQQAQIASLLNWAGDLSDTEVVRVTTASNSQATQLHNAVADYFQTIVDDQVVPESALQQISYVMDGHIAVTQQQIYTAYDGTKILNQPDLYQWIGIERGAIEQLADARPAGDPDATNLRSQNVQRQSTVTIGEGVLRYEPALALYDTLNTQSLDEAATALEQNADEARTKALLNMGILAVSLLTTLLLAWLIARLILGPVRTVRDDALAVAHEHLPRAVARIRAGEEPGTLHQVNVHTDEEMGQLARAVDDLHRTAVDLAAGEAELRSQVGEMFVTLSRRNTSLINQQLGLIEDLERDEQDPRRLENLFRLDHLAARMRRTAESLVILSDAPVRQRESAPLAVTDALQAATAGVQEYQRVELRGATPAQLVGAAANDVVHLVTELIDNALSFSPPTAPVQVSTTGGNGEVIISISDGGLGMPADMLKQLNDMLGSSVDITPDAARRMGLFVVSRLAHRHSITVNLAENGRGGITATVALPSALVVGGVPTTIAPAADSASSAVVLEDPASADTPSSQENPLFAPAPEDDAPQVSTDRAPDPLNDPLPVAEDPQVEAINAVISGSTGLPKRQPGATVPARVAAVNPMGTSLFGGSTDTQSGGLFARNDDASEETAAPKAESEATDADVQVVHEQSSEPDSAPDIAESAETVDAASDDNADEVSPGEIVTEGVSAPETEAVAEPVEVADEQPTAVRSLPTRSAAPYDEPVTPATTDASAVDMFGTSGADTRSLPERNHDDNPVAAARMGMFNALARGPRTAQAKVSNSRDGSSPLEHQSSTPTPNQQRVADLAAEVISESSSVTAPSGWLSGDESSGFANSGADAGWAAAEKVAKHVETETTGAGLPQRRPGQRLVPGAVAPTRNAPPRDPEAIRKRLASHAAGVSRGRSATVTSTTPAQEEGQA